MKTASKHRQSALLGSMIASIALVACGDEASEADAVLRATVERSASQVVKSISVDTEIAGVAIASKGSSPDLDREELLAAPSPSPAPAPAPAPASFAQPRIATYFLRNVMNSAALQQSVGRFGLVVTGLSGSQMAMQATIDGMRKVNPSLKLGIYTVIVEADRTPSMASNLYQSAIAVQANDWWVYNANGQHVQWTTDFGTDLVNITAWAPKDSVGRRYPQWMAQHKADLLGKLKGMDYIFVDNTWYMPRPRTGSMDWMRNGTNQASYDPQIQTAYRQAQQDYWTALRGGMPGIRIMGNADNDLSYPEFKGKLQGSLLECAFGKSWSALNTRGWAGMMGYYRAMLANTAAPKDVILQGCSPSGVDLPLLRFGLSSALLEDGWFGYTITGETQPYWADEYAAKLGTATEAPPSAPTASGIWMRRYTNGIVLVNPGATTASINIGPGYRHISGSQDPVVNSGLPVSTVTLEPNRGVIVIRR